MIRKLLLLLLATCHELLLLTLRLNEEIKLRELARIQHRRSPAT